MKLLTLALIALVTLFACHKEVNKACPRVMLGDSVAFSPKVYPQKNTQDINDNYLFGDSVYAPKNCILKKIALNVFNTGGYTTKCKLIVNNEEIATIGRPTYISPNDSTFTFFVSVQLNKGWNFIKFTGFSWAPSTIYYKIFSGDVAIVDGGDALMEIYGLPLSRERKF
jgi:hypothetical protein